jgi:hypothetical protein
MILSMDGEPRDLKFSELANLDKSYRSLAVTNDALKECVVAFVANLDRAIALAEEMMPLAMGYAEFARWVTRLPDSTPSRNETTGEVVQIPVQRPSLINPELHRESDLAVGYEDIDFWRHSFPDIPRGMEAVLAGQVVFAWTAFETMGVCAGRAGSVWRATGPAMRRRNSATGCWS